MKFNVIQITLGWGYMCQGKGKNGCHAFCGVVSSSGGLLAMPSGNRRLGLALGGWITKAAVARVGFSKGVVLDLAENLSFSGSGRPRVALKPSKKVGGGEAPHFIGRFQSPCGPPRPRKRPFVSQIPHPPSAKQPSGFAMIFCHLETSVAHAD